MPQENPMELSDKVRAETISKLATTLVQVIEYKVNMEYGTQQESEPSKKGMVYVKPRLIKVPGDIPPVTVNFAPPPTETGENIAYK